MKMSMVMALVIASLLFGGCGNRTKRIAEEPVPRTDQRGTVPNNSASPDRLKKPPVRQQEEPPDRTKPVRDDRNENKQQTAPKKDMDKGVFEGSMGSVLLGLAVAMVVPNVVPALASSLRPLVKALAKGGVLFLMRRGKASPRPAIVLTTWLLRHWPK